METPLKQLLYECSKGLYYELRLKNTFDDAAVLKVYEDEIAKRLGNSSDARWELAFTIARLVRSGAWVAFHEATVQLCNKWDHEHPGCSSHGNPYNPIGGNWWRENPIYLFTFLKEKFGLCRTTVYNLLEVVDTFATYIDDKGKQPEYSINAEAKQFQFWQLVEMLSLTYQERLKVQPNWTREEIRAYKRSLRQKENDKIQPAEQVEPEEKPLTEAQQRFAKYSKDDLINLVLELEGAVEAKKQEVERVLACPPSVESVLPLKGELAAVIEKLLKPFDYQIILCGRKQAIKTFAGALAKRILEKCASDTDISPSDPLEGDCIQEKFAV